MIKAQFYATRMDRVELGWLKMYPDPYYRRGVANFILIVLLTGF